MMIRTKAAWGVCALLVLTLGPVSLGAQAQDPQDPQAPPAPVPPLTPASQTAPAVPPPATDPDLRLDPLQPDFNLAALPVTLRLPKGKMSFRVTHRFTRSLGRGDMADLASDLFGFDSGAQIGLEVRYGLRPGTQIGVNRTSDRTIEIFGQQSVLQQNDTRPIGLDVIATIEGANNFVHTQGATGENVPAQKSSALGLIASRKIARLAAVYAEPIVVFNTNSLPSGPGVDNNTFMLGLGTRVRIRPTAYIVAEMTPRLAGYTPGVTQGSIGLEGRVGGHTFQINFSNGFGTTLGQIARGGIGTNSWFIGFNISRKFF